MGAPDSKIVEELVGIPWKDDGRDLSGMDCAGLMHAYYQRIGIQVEAPEARKINASEEDIRSFIKKVMEENHIVQAGESLQPEDLMIFKIDEELHVALYLGYDRMLHAFRGGKSRISRLDKSWQKYFLFAVRPRDGKIYIPPSGPPAVVAVAFVIADYAAASFIAGGLIAASWGLAFCLIGTAMIGYSVGLAMQQMNRSRDSGSQRYSLGELQTTSTNQAIVPIIYGEVRYAGNFIFQSPLEGGEEVDRLLLLCLGEVESITDVRLNGEAIANFPGCTYTAFLGTPTQNVQTTTGLDLHGVQYRNLACLHLHLKVSDKLNGSVNVTAIIKGRKVQTWTGSAWATSKAWTKNPSACVRDYLLTRFNIGGCGYKTSDVDDVAFGEVYDRAIESVPDGNGGTEARYELDYVIDQKRAASDNLSEMLVGFGGSLIRSGSQLKLIVSKPDIKIYDFDEDEVKDLIVLSKGLDQKINRFGIEYFDPDQDDAKILVWGSEDKADQDDRGVIEETLTIPSISRSSQALRLSNQYFYEMKLCPVSVEFTADISSIGLEIGKVFTLTHSLMGWVEKKFITQRIEESQIDTYKITAQEYNPSIYNDRYGATIETFNYGTPPNPYAPVPDVSNLSAVEGDYYLHRDGTVSSDVLVSFNAPMSAGREFLSHYQIELKKESGEFQPVGTTTKTSFTISGVEDEKPYQVKVRTVSINSVISDGVDCPEFTVLGKMNPPDDVTGFEVYQEGNMLHLSWNALDIVTNPDLSRYEIRKGGGGDWSRGQIVGEKVDSTEMISPIGEIGQQIYMVKAFDRSGNESVSPAIDIITIVAPPDMNFVNNFDRWNLPFDHILSGLEIVQTNDYDTALVRPCLALKTATLWEDRLAEGKTWEQQETDGGLMLNGQTVASGYSEMVYPLDLQTILDVKLIIDASYKNVSGGTVTVQVSYSEDGINYVAFADINADQSYRGRYFKFKIILATSDINHNVFLNSLMIYFHAPSVKKSWFKDVLIPITGKTLLFDSGFTMAPKVSATVVNGVVGLVSLGNKTKDSVDVMVYGFPSGSAIGTAEVDLTAEGY